MWPRGRYFSLLVAFGLLVLLQCARQKQVPENEEAGAGFPPVSEADSDYRFEPRAPSHSDPLIVYRSSRKHLKTELTEQEFAIAEPEIRDSVPEEMFFEREPESYLDPIDRIETPGSDTRSIFNSIGATLDTFGLATSARSLLQEPDGKLVLGGFSYDGTKLNFMLARYNPDGTLDTTFGGGTGSTTAHIGNGTDDVIHAIATDHLGRIVAAGRAHYGSTGGYYQWGVARFNTDGSVDSSFNGTGSVVSVFNSLNSVPRALLLQTDDKIVTVGYAATVTSNYNYAVALARYNTNGTLDTSFATTGQVITKVINSNNVAYGATLQADGRIIAVGYINNGTIQSVILRYNTDGSLDHNFNGTGINTTDFNGNLTNLYNAAAMQSDQKIVAAGYVLNSKGNTDFSVARYTTSGILDTAFATGRGLTQIDMLNKNNDYARAVTVTPNYTIVLAGKTFNSTRDEFAVLRLNTDGSQDADFGANGILVTSVSASPTAYDQGLTLFANEGGVWVAGRSLNTVDNIASLAMLRLNAVANNNANLMAASGDQDRSFDSAGSKIGATLVNIGPNSDTGRNGIIQPDGRLLVVGITVYSNDDFGIARLNSDGSLDTTGFGGLGGLAQGGVTVASFPNQGIPAGKSAKLMSDDANAVLLQEDGRIVAVGVSFQSASDFAALRLTTNGQIDSSFGSNGFVTHSFPAPGRPGAASATDEAYAALLQTDGRIIAIGRSFQSYFNYALLRLTTTGAIDSSFGNNGFVTTTFPRAGTPGVGDDEAYAAALYTDGRIVVAGRVLSSAFNFGLVRYTTSGALDSSFGVNGLVTTSFPYGGSNGGVLSSAEAWAVAVMTDGRIVAGGRSFQSGWTPALVRYTTNGAIDSSFGDGSSGQPGVVLSTFVTLESGNFHALAIQPNGKVVAGAWETGDMVIARYLQNGLLDTSLGAGGPGFVLTSFSGGVDQLNGMALAADGKIVLYGRSSSANGDFAVMRIWP